MQALLLNTDAKIQDRESLLVHTSMTDATSASQQQWLQTLMMLILAGKNQMAEY